MINRGIPRSISINRHFWIKTKPILQPSVSKSTISSSVVDTIKPPHRPRFARRHPFIFYFVAVPTAFLGSIFLLVLLSRNLILSD
jgi:hypothetical protein